MTGSHKIALIGAGFMASEHGRAMKATSGLSLAGIFSRSRPRAEELAGKLEIENVADSVKALYERTHADAVIVTVTELGMLEVAQQCFQYPWTVLLEKPAGYNLSQSGSILAAATSLGRRAYVALNRRFFGSTLRVLEHLKAVADPRVVIVQDQQDTVAALGSGQPREVVDNWMFANSIHLVDYFSSFCRGEPVHVRPVWPYRPGTSQMVLAELEYSSGDKGIYQGIWRGPGPWVVQVCTEQARWELRPLEVAHLQLKGQRTVETFPAPDFDTQYKPGLRKMAEELLACLSGKPHGLIPLAEAHKSMQLTAEIFSKRE